METLHAKVPKGNYTETQPITFYTEHLDRKNYYKSASVGLNPFAKTSGFTQPVQCTRAVANYEGNVNFGKETMTAQKLATTKDLYKENPFQSYPKKEIYNYEQLKVIFWQMSQDYTFGVRQIRKFLQNADLNKNGYLDPEEIRAILAKLGLTLVKLFKKLNRGKTNAPQEEENLKLILKNMDRNKDGKVSIDEFLDMFTDKVSESRKKIVSMVYGKLAKATAAAGGKVTFQTVVKLFNAKVDPLVTFLVLRQHL